MASYNRIILLGNLTRDPQLSYTPSNTAVCKFGLATNRRFRDASGNDREETCYVDCTVFGRAAETFNQYMTKGRPVLVEGRLQYSQWQTQEGDKRSKHEVVVENFQFVGGPGREGQGGQVPAPARASAAGPSYDEPPAGKQGFSPSPEDDIPF